MDQSAAQSLTVKLDEDDGVTYYEIEFCSAGVEYDYEINATTGDVVKFEQDTCDHYAHRSVPNSSTNQSQNQNQNQGNSNGSYIGYDAALQAACKHAGVDASQGLPAGETSWTTTMAVARYEISFHVGNMKYEYEINATTGQVLKYESERDDWTTAKSLAALH